MNKIYVKALGMWFLMCIIAILNGIIRNGVYSPIVGEYFAHVISSFILICIFFLVIALYYNNIKGKYENRDPLYIGVLWLISTIAFEFIFGHYIVGHSWEHLFADYNIFQGRIWIFVLITPIISSILWGKYFQKKKKEKN
ncbi:MAG: hypothetical protein ACTSRI_14720 [Promethearchaeota archaeon]